MTRRRGSSGVLATLAFLALFAFVMYCAAGFAGNIPSPGPGLATRAVESSSWLGLWGQYLAVTFLAQPFDILVGMAVFAVVLYLVAAVALGDGD